jgi:hypothetical protein
VSQRFLQLRSISYECSGRGRIVRGILIFVFLFATCCLAWLESDRTSQSCRVTRGYEPLVKAHVTVDRAVGEVVFRSAND